MELLKSIRNKYGLSQREMAAIIQMTRDHYAMVETNRRMLPANLTSVLPALIPLFTQEFSLPTYPAQLPEYQHAACHQKWLEARQALYIAEKNLLTCEAALLQQEMLAYLIEVLAEPPLFIETPKYKRLIEALQYKKATLEKTANKGVWMLLTTQKQIAENTVQAYEALLPKPPES